MTGWGGAGRECGNPCFPLCWRKTGGRRREAGMATEMKRSTGRGANWEAEMAALHEKTQALGLYEFWSVGKQGEHEAVRDLAKFQKAVPHIWKYSDIRPCLVVV